LYVEVDQIYNLACPASPIHYQFDPVQTTKTSVHGAINMLGLAKRLKAKSFKPRLLKYMVTRKFILRQKNIGVVSIQSVSEVVMTKESGVLKPYFLTIGVNTNSRLK
jgi:hypothetical protein